MLVKLLFKMACVGAIAAGGMTWLASSQGKDPMAYLSALDLKMPSAPNLSSMPDLPKLGSATAAPTTVYRWTDANGVPQFSTSPPDQNVAFKTMRVDPNANVIQAHKIVEKPKPETTTRSDTNSTSQSAQSQSEEPVSRADVGKIKEQLEQIKSINANRTQDLDALLNSQTR